MAVQTTQRTPWWRRWWMIVIYCIVALLVVISAVNGIRTGGEGVKPPLLTEEQKNRLEHCAGYEVTIERVIKRNLKDADSFEWRESSFGLPAGESLTVLTAGADGKAPFVAHYRAKNSFGALTLGEAVGYIERDGCVVHLTAAE